jgi:ribosome-binding factor A
MSRRQERLSSIIQREIAMIVMREIADPRIGPIYPTINSVKLSEDLSYADVYVSIMGTAGQRTAAMAALKGSAGMIRSKLAKTIEIRQVPAIRFHIDQGAIKEIEMLDLLRKIEDERQKDAASKNPTPLDPAQDN